MKATGIVRRIDDLGRIVIPKEIRKTLMINDGDSLEIYVNNNEIVLSKYSFFNNIEVIAKKLVSVFNNIYKKKILITDKEKIIVCSKELESSYLNRNISNDIKKSIIDRIESIGNKKIVDKMEKIYLIPIIVDSDAIGSIILISDLIDDNDKNIIKLLSAILIKNIEE